MKSNKAILALSDGKIFEGTSFGAVGVISGNSLVFGTDVVFKFILQRR